MTPQLHASTNGVKVPTWTPGEEIPDGKYDYKKLAEGSFGDGKALTTVVSVTVVIFLLIVACVGIKCYRNKQRRKRRRAIAAQQVPQ